MYVIAVISPDKLRLYPKLLKCKTSVEEVFVVKMVTVSNSHRNINLVHEVLM